MTRSEKWTLAAIGLGIVALLTICVVSWVWPILQARSDRGAFASATTLADQTPLATAPATQSVIASLLTGTVGIVILIFLAIWAMLWLVFPVFVYYLLRKIERNTRRP